MTPSTQEHTVVAIYDSHIGAETAHVARENILRLLSDDEVASVSYLEATARLLDGEEYLDLQELGQGIRNDFGTSTTPMGHVLPRRAVHPATWDKILERLALLHVARAKTESL